MNQLALYDTARAMLAEAVRVDEVKQIRDKAEAIRAYARLASETQLEADALELRMRAERRMGVMLVELKAAGELAPGRPKNGSDQEPLKLADLGIDKKLSWRAQKSGGIAEAAFEAMVARKRAQIIAGAARVAFDISTDEKRAKRDANERALADRQLALPDKRYGVIYADPEWRFEPRSRETGMDRAADNHYATSSTAAICARPVASIAADDCALFLWATAPMLPDALAVLACWGFTYKSHLIWHKIRPGDGRGSGYWFTGEHELLLVGTRGRIPAPATALCGSVVAEPWAGRHSQKPEAFAALIERAFPNLPKIELNARAARPGWDVWGAEAPTDAAGAELIHNPETGEITAP